MIKWKLLTSVGGDTGAYIGKREYLQPGDFEFQVPLGIRRIHVCCIGAGGAANAVQQGGGGGGLAWANNIEVVPGEKLKVSVGACSGTNQADSSVQRGSDRLIYAEHGRGDNIAGGGFGFGDGISGGGGRGGSGSPSDYDNFGGGVMATYLGAGGGAGGYSGNGGNANGGAPAENSGGGSAGTRFYVDGGSTQGTFPGGRGGGVGVNGIGADGPEPGIQGGFEPARDGKPGSGGENQNYGGGSSGQTDNGGNGAVRIIWGIKYGYPDKADIEAVE